jgi:hypothetical protein
MSRLGTFNIDGVEYDLDDLTLDEMEEVENLVDGTPFSEINYGSTRGMKAFSFVLMKRNKPDLTMEEVGQLKVGGFIQPEESMPALPPDGRGDPESQTESPRDDSGAPPSVVSITG